MTFPMEWYLLFLVSIPQVFLGLLLGLALFKLQITWPKLLVVCVIGGVFSYLMRLFPMNFGLSSAINVAVTALLLRIIGDIRLSYALCATMMSMMTVTVVECCIIPIELRVTGLDIKAVQSNQLLLFLFFIPEALILGTLFYMVRITNFKMWDLNELSKNGM